MTKKKKLEELEMAPEMQADEPSEAAPEDLMEFDEWYALRQPAIPKHHHKEILKADFKARKVPARATQAQFDEALRKYGVKLD